ncbi:MAG TPA: hypothetical protein DCQ31_18390, partial [Bacteroidales bacterium]|nr:hypothetical protein [Bacteroidales bacterium]
AFYLLSRYEEYLPHKTDKYQRFDEQTAYAIIHKFEHLPVIELWVEFFFNKMKELFPDVEFQPFQHKKFEFIPTIDIDSFYAHKGKGFWRTAASFFINLKKGNFEVLAEKVQVLLNLKPDPFQTFDLIEALHTDIENLHFFVSVADFGKFDKNISYKNNRFREKMVALARNYSVGLHPGFESNFNKKILETELHRLSAITNTAISTSRQHYLKLSFPSTYRNLIELGFKTDFTMGWSSALGFRAGTCNKHLFFDLKENKSTRLAVIPFQVMDVSLFEYLKLNREQANERITQIIAQIANVNGIFVSIWHNETFSEFNNSEKNKVYLHTLKLCRHWIKR